MFEAWHSYIPWSSFDKFFMVMFPPSTLILLLSWNIRSPIWKRSCSWNEWFENILMIRELDDSNCFTHIRMRLTHDTAYHKTTFKCFFKFNDTFFQVLMAGGSACDSHFNSIVSPILFWIKMAGLVMKCGASGNKFSSKLQVIISKMIGYHLQCH